MATLAVLTQGCGVDHRVFINYRGEDSHSYGALLYNDLVHRFGQDRIFLDCESIPAGADFATELLHRVRSARTMLAVIGPCWLTAIDPAEPARRRIDDPADWIRRELVEAFTAEVRVIPVLTDQAELPRESDLPSDIAALSRCQARPLRRREPTADLARIVADLISHDPALAGGGLANTVTGAVPGALFQADAITGGVHAHPPPPGPASEQPQVRVGVPPMLADRYQTRDLYAELEQAAKATGTVVLTQVLSGTGGVGKTQLAAHYATERWNDPELRLALWIAARSRDAIVASYAEAAVELLGADPRNPDQAVARLLAWLSTTDQQWLIVLDDLQKPEDLHRLWPPTSAISRGRVVATTRRRDPSLTRTDRVLLDVGVFTEAEAVSYLHAKLADRPHLHDGADGLAADLGYLPLGLAQAVAYLANRGLTCGQYRDRLADRHGTLHHVLPEPGELPDDHDYTAAATFALSIELADTLAPEGLTGPIMLLASLLDPTGIPLALFTTNPVLTYLTTVVGRSVSADDARDALHLAHRLSLATLDQQEEALPAVRVHALVQRATRDNAGIADPDQVTRAARAAADALRELWPDIERDAILVQALRTNTNALRDNTGSALWQPDTHSVLFRAGRSLGEAGLVASARDYFQHLHTTTQTLLGPDHQHTLTTRNNLAYWRGEAGEFTEAVQAYEQLLTDYRRVLGPDHPHTLAARNNLASLRGQTGDYTEAVQAYEQLLTDRLRVLGPDHPDTLTTRNNLAYWWGEAGEFTEAVQAYEQLLTDYRRVLGPDHPHTLAARNNLASLRGQTGDYTEAIQAYEQLLTDYRRVLGPDHRHTLTTHNNLAYWWGKAGNFTKAVQAFEQLLADRLRVLGPDHPDTLTTRNYLASWRGEAGDLIGAVQAFERLLADRLRVLGPDHPHTLTTRGNLAFWRSRMSEVSTNI